MKKHKCDHDWIMKDLNLEEASVVNLLIDFIQENCYTRIILLASVLLV